MISKIFEDIVFKANISKNGRFFKKHISRFWTFFDGVVEKISKAVDFTLWGGNIATTRSQFLIALFFYFCALSIKKKNGMEWNRIELNVGKNIGFADIILRFDDCKSWYFFARHATTEMQTIFPLFFCLSNNHATNLFYIYRKNSSWMEYFRIHPSLEAVNIKSSSAAML